MSDWKFGSDWMAKMGNIGEKTPGPVTIYGGMVMEQLKKNREKFKAAMTALSPIAASG